MQSCGLRVVWVGDALAHDADVRVAIGDLEHTLLGETDVGAVLEVEDANFHAVTLSLPVHWNVKGSSVPDVRIGDLSERSGVPAKTIRFWEQAGLVAAPARTDSGYRDYGDDTLSVLRFVRSAQAAGFTVAEIADIIDIRSRGDAPCEHVTALIDRHLSDIDRRMKELRLVRTQLRTLAANADTLDPARCTDSPVCQIIDA